MRAVITLEDKSDETGSDVYVHCGVIYEGKSAAEPGFNVGSNAHQHVALILKVMDRLMIIAGERGPAVPVTDEKVFEEIDQAFADVEAAENSTAIDIVQSDKINLDSYFKVENHEKKIIIAH